MSADKPIDWQARAERLAQMLVGRQEALQDQLDAAIREAKADAWDEGHMTDTHGPLTGLCDCKNPYRDEEVPNVDR